MSDAVNVEVATSNAATATAEELFERATALRPVLRERGPDADAQRKLPQDTIDDLARLGFLRAVQPERFGGMGHDLEVVADFSAEIARGCGASGWLSAFMPIHQFMVGWFTEQAQEEYWGRSVNTYSSTVPGFAMTREEVDGGIRLNGKASFSSGVDYSDWVLLHTAIETCLVPREDFEIVDDWQVSGLRATGSKSVQVDNIFVPTYRTVTNEALGKGTYPGAELYDSPWYQVQNPLVLILNHFILAPVIGMARGVLDIFDERVRTRLDPQTFTPAVERAGPQLRFAEASAEVDVAEMLLKKNLALVRAAGEARRPLSLETRAGIRRNISYASKLVLQSTNRLVDGMDSSALYDKNLLHRQARDVRAGNLQFVLQWEETAIQFSRVMWGMEPNTRMI